MPTDEWSLFQNQGPSESDIVYEIVGQSEVESPPGKAKCHGD